MLKARVPIGSTSVELEAFTKRELEDALEAALNVAMRLNTMQRKAYREAETPSVGSPAREFPPVQAGGDTAPPIPEEDPTISEANAPPARRVSYKGAERIADYVRIALKHLGEQYGIDKWFTTAQIRQFLEDTKGDHLIRKNRRPTSAISQAINNSDSFIRKDGLNRLAEWERLEQPEEKIEDETQPQEQTELPQFSPVSS